MSDYYNRLAEKATELNSERETLIIHRSKILNELHIISVRMESLDKLLEENYKEQEPYWPKCREPESELTFTSDVIKSFYANPDRTCDELAEDLGINKFVVKRELDNHFSKKLANIKHEE